jgi:hypothetical protein
LLLGDVPDELLRALLRDDAALAARAGRMVRLADGVVVEDTGPGGRAGAVPAAADPALTTSLETPIPDARHPLPGRP